MSTATVTMTSYFDDDESSEGDIMMPHQQRTIVNTYFEESQFEFGIQALDRLRSQRYLPTIGHIRQLIYISIYPPEEHTDIPITNSPRKLQQHRLRRERLPSPEASRLAVNILCAFSRTNGPQALFQAIPHYRGFGGKSVGFKDNSAGDEAVTEEMKDSPIGDDARRAVGEAADCWDLVKADVVKRVGRASSVDSKEEDSDTTMNLAVGNHSWGLLEALVVSFEEDERRNATETNLKFSPTLLKHVPRMRPPLPWNFERPLSVVFSCLTSSQDAPGQPYHPHRAQLGVRLLSLIINTTLEDSRLAGSTRAIVQLCIKDMRQIYISSQQLQYLFTSLLLVPQYRPFVIMLICAYLEGSAVIHGPTESKGSSTPRPKARPRPRIAAAAATEGTTKAEHSDLAPEEQVSIDPYPLPSLETILRHLASSSVTPHFALATPERKAFQNRNVDRLELDAQKSAVAKLHLLQCLDAILISPASTSDFAKGKTTITGAQWAEALREKRIHKALRTGFTHTAGLTEDSLFKSLFISLCESVAGDLESKSAGATREDVTMGA